MFVQILRIEEKLFYNEQKVMKKPNIINKDHILSMTFDW